MPTSQDTEITLGTGKLLVLFFGLVSICALFFALGYSLGRHAEPGIAAAASSPQVAASTAKPATAGQSPSMGFYKAVEQKDPNPNLPADGKPDTNNAPAGPNDQPTAAASPESSVTLPTAGYFVQVAAVSKQDDADALVDALKKKQYPAFVANSADKLFHVQVGPFTDIKEAESLRARLISDGYNPILKK